MFEDFEVILSPSCPLSRKRLKNTWNINILKFWSLCHLLWFLSVYVVGDIFFTHILKKRNYFAVCFLSSRSALQVFKDKPYWQVFPGSCLNCTSWKTVNLFLLLLRTQQQPCSPKVFFIVIPQPHLSPMSYKANLWKEPHFFNSIFNKRKLKYIQIVFSCSLQSVHCSAKEHFINCISTQEQIFFY